MVKNKKLMIVVCVVFLIGILAVSAYVYLFLSMNRLPEGEFLYSSYNLNGEYKVNIYRCNNSLSADSIRGEIENVNTGEKENIYWCYRRSYADINWIDKYNVIINGEKINIIGDKYDWRKDRYFNDDYELLKDSLVDNISDL